MKLEKLTEKEMKALKGGWKREVNYDDENGDGREDVIVTIYDRHGNIKRRTVSYK